MTRVFKSGSRYLELRPKALSRAWRTQTTVLESGICGSGRARHLDSSAAITPGLSPNRKLGTPTGLLFGVRQLAMVGAVRKIEFKLLHVTPSGREFI